MYDDFGFSRRELLLRTAGGLGGIALACLLAEDKALAGQIENPKSKIESPLPHFAPRAKRVVQIFCMGGVSHIDTFDYKPELEKHDGKAMTGKGKVDTFFGQPGNLMKSPFAFRRRGRSGLWASDLLPNLAECVDDMTFIRSMVSKSANHTPATFFMNTGFTMNGFPCLGAWLSYGLGTENEDLPAFVVLPDSRGVPAGGSINWTSGFLPATHQGVAFGTGKEPIPDLFPADPAVQAHLREASGFVGRMNRAYAAEDPGDSALEARIRAYELAAKMQVSIPEAVSIDTESEATKRLYGLDNPASAPFGRNCLMARRLLERGVRFVQLCHGGAFGGNPRINWDAHEDIVDNHTRQAGTMDRPVAGLLRDLKARGLLEDTLVLCTTEFGRTPITQGLNAKGRDHHPHAFTVWMAGGGLKPGYAYGNSDEIGYSVDNPTTVYDFHATVLHLLGIDHKRLTFYHNGIQRRLTDVHGSVVGDVIA